MNEISLHHRAESGLAPGFSSPDDPSIRVVLLGTLRVTMIERRTFGSAAV
jgi:hypothetical protein